MPLIGSTGTTEITTYQVRRDGVEYDLEVAEVVRLEITIGALTISTVTGGVSFEGFILNVEWGVFNLSAGRYTPTFTAFRVDDSVGEDLFGDDIGESVFVLFFGGGELDCETIQELPVFNTDLGTDLEKLARVGASSVIVSVSGAGKSCILGVTYSEEARKQLVRTSVLGAAPVDVNGLGYIYPEE